MTLLDTPILIIISGEGGSGGALGIAVGDRVLMQEFAIYSVIPPEGCAAILWRDASKKVEAAKALKLTAPDLLHARIIDEIIPEPVGGAHTDPAAAARLLDGVLTRVLGEIGGLDSETRLQQRYEKFRRMGRLGVDFVDEGRVTCTHPASTSRPKAAGLAPTTCAATDASHVPARVIASGRRAALGLPAWPRRRGGGLGRRSGSSRRSPGCCASAAWSRRTRRAVS